VLIPAAMRFAQALEADGVTYVAGADPCTLPKAIKTKAEIAGAQLDPVMRAPCRGAQCIHHPPSTVRFWPVMNRA